jgi:hypothetical protein
MDPIQINEITEILFMNPLFLCSLLLVGIFLLYKYLACEVSPFEMTIEFYEKKRGELWLQSQMRGNDLHIVNYTTE